MGGFEELDHTADYALRVWGSDLRDLMEAAGRGLISLLSADRPLPPAARWEPFRVEAPDPEGLVVRALRRLLQAAESTRAPVAFEVSRAQADPPGAEGRVGLAAESARPSYRHIKAVTYHDLQIRSAPEGLGLTLTFDT